MSLPTYIPSVNTIYVFAVKGGNTYLLALSGTKGALKAPPIKFDSGVTLSSYFVYDALNNRLFIGGLENSRIMAISSTTNKVVANFPAPDGAYSIAYDGHNNQLYTAANHIYSTGVVDVFNAATGTLKGRIQLRPAGFTGVETNSIVYDGNNHNVYVDYDGYNSSSGAVVNQVAVISGQLTSCFYADERPRRRRHLRGSDWCLHGF